MWITAKFSPTTLFSLRPANATTSGGKTLITPTPYTVKMALLDASIRVYGKSKAETWFPRIRDLAIAVKLPDQLTVINTFIKILRPYKGGAKDVSGTGLVGPMGNTIAYRELVQFAGSLYLAVQDSGSKGETPPLQALFTQIHYFGKRGGFMQLAGMDHYEDLPASFVLLTSEIGETFQFGGVMQLLDDCGPKMTFDHADIYSSSKLALNKPNGRLLRSIILPYRVERSSRGYTLYRRVE